MATATSATMISMRGARRRGASETYSGAGRWLRGLGVPFAPGFADPFPAGRLEAGAVVFRGAVGWATRRPQCRQNCAPGATGAPQRTQ